MWIIRNAAGEICGSFTDKPGEGNLLPDGSEEKPIYVEDDQLAEGYDADALLEVVEFGRQMQASIDLTHKRSAAIAALARQDAEQRMAAAAKGPNAPQEVKDYLAAVAALKNREEA